MSDTLRAKGESFAKFLKTLSPEIIEYCNKRNQIEAEAEFQSFKENFKKNNCYLCGKPLTSFSKKLPCIHWLLKPKGFKKKDLPAVAAEYGFYQIQAFLRWAANLEAVGKNINDLKAEGTGNKLFEVTIKWKHIEWAFACSESDYQGHATSQHSKHPHYHFQMRVDNRPFINYNDFHLAFSEKDLINIEAMRAEPEQLTQKYYFGEGVSDILSDYPVEHIISASTHADDKDDCTFRFTSFAKAEEGSTINSDDVCALMKEAQATGVTIASLLHRLPNAKTRIIVSPGPGVVEQAPREGRKRNATHQCSEPPLAAAEFDGSPDLTLAENTDVTDNTGTAPQGITKEVPNQSRDAS